jgi:DNA polymerase-3 subunit gamma/tau
MSYQVLARKYRPQSFEEVIGQEHVTQTWKNAILKSRLHHGYLLTGARGTGKTSLARVFAKALSCEKGPTPTPCNECSNCRSITQGNFLDVIEIDGASNTSVESVRELREQVKYLPAAGRYKIYIIDEVHMLSNAAFNALLKTLEEPPPHVLFVFATTEAHKIPITILSRCQRFDLRRIPQTKIAEQLEKICQEEKVGTDALSLELLARAAEGSMRDSQSLLDMAIGLCGGQLDAAKIQEMLGLAGAGAIQDLSADCLAGRLNEALAKVEDLYRRGFDLRQIALQWVQYLHDLTLLKAAGPEALGEGVLRDSLTTMQKTVETVELADLQVAFQTVYRASEEMARSDAPKILFDLLVVKLVHGHPFQSLPALLGGKISPLSSAPSSKTPVSSPTPKSESSARPEPGSTATASDPGLLERVFKKRPQIKALLDHALSQTWEGNRFIVAFEPGSIWLEMFADKRPALAEALSQELGAPVKVELKTDERGRSRPAPTNVASAPSAPVDPVVQQAMEILNASLKE